MKRLQNGFWWNEEKFRTYGLSMKCVGDWIGMSGSDADGVFSHDFWVLDFSFEYFGDFPCGRDKEWIPRGAGIAQLIRKDAKYYRRNSKSLKSHCAFIGFFNGESAKLEKLTDDSGTAIFRDSCFQTGKAIAKAASIASQQGENAYWKVMGILCEIIGILHSAKIQPDGTYIIEKKANESNYSTDIVKKLNNFLSLNLERRISLNEMAEILKISVSKLTHSYSKLNMGRSPQEVHLQMRLAMAREFLLTGYSIKESAERFAFSDVHHFSKAFKENFGLTPGEFRQKYRQD